MKYLQWVLGVGVAIALWLSHPFPVQASPNVAADPAELGKAVQSIESLDQMRSGLASTLKGREEEPTLETMKQVCKPVGMQAKKLSQENGWKLRQVAAKYRNPNHAPKTASEEQAIAQFKENPQLVAFWENETLDGVEGVHYFRRIQVEESCLACHGLKSDRPTFVKKNYPQDLAYNFKVGDLRGMYSVFIPQVKAEIEAALQK